MSACIRIHGSQHSLVHTNRHLRSSWTKCSQRRHVCILLMQLFQLGLLHLWHDTNNYKMGHFNAPASTWIPSPLSIYNNRTVALATGHVWHGRARVGRQTRTGGKQRAWTDDVRRPAAGAGEGRGDHTVRGLRGVRVQAGRADGRAGRRGSRRPKYAWYWLVYLNQDVIFTFYFWTPKYNQVIWEVAASCYFPQVSLRLLKRLMRYGVAKIWLKRPAMTLTSRIQPGYQ